ncbi:hypothetical protein B0H14DRAFT_2610761 [Mycena olivaceomarginata]|nr:hypothetical protein B0H14DRAFT_2610761 [Mycena olivaceomarginata]
MSDDDTAPLTATENAALRALLARAAPTPQSAGNGNGGVSVQTDNTAGEIDNFASPTFKSLPVWFPRVKSAVLDLIIEGKFEGRGPHKTELSWCGSSGTRPARCCGSRTPGTLAPTL